MVGLRPPPIRRATVASGPPPIIVFVDIPEAGGALPDPAPPAHLAPMPGRRDLPEIFMGGGGIEPRDMEQLRRWTKKLNPKGLRMLRGRFPFAVSEHLARLAELREFGYVTFLRDPVDRLAAQFLNART